MQIEPYVLQVQAQLAAAASLGDDTTRAIAEALATAAQPGVRLAMLGAIGAAADEITAALLDAPGSPVVGVRLDGDEVRIDVRPTAPGEPVVEQPPADADDAESNARISLRLPEALKGQIEEAARAESVSVNTWLVRVAARALAGPATPPWGGNPWGGGWGPHGWAGHPWAGKPGRLSGWINA